MKLTDLDPRWIQTRMVRAGISFLCPCCRSVRLTCFVEHTPHQLQFRMLADCGIIEVDEDGDPKRADIVPCNPQAKWQISGDNFENVSITPSIDASASGHWHGYVTGGRAQ